MSERSGAGPAGPPRPAAEAAGGGPMVAVAALEHPPVAPGRSSPARASLRILLGNPLTLLGAAGVLLLCFVAIFAPFLAPHSVSVRNLTETLDLAMQAPSREHLFGTDWHGSDVFSKVILGTRISLGIGIAASALSMLIGLIVGVSSGFFGGWVDSLLMRFTDVVLAFPSLLLTILIAATLEPGLTSIFLALTVSGWAGNARLVRSLVLMLREQEFILAAVGAGAGPGRLIARHILPNCLSTLIVLLTMRVGITILSEASLNFLGLGAPAQAPSWGVMVFYGMDHITRAPWCSIWPASAIAFTVLCFNLLGDGLRDALDPKMRDVL